MALIKTIEGISPNIHESCYLAETAVVIGKTSIGKNSSVWFNAVIRADVNEINIGEYTNVQDNACVHCTFEKAATHIGNYVTIGHNAVVHGCTIHDYVLIGMGAVVMDHVIIGEGAIIGAGAVITENTIVPAGTIWAGVPAKQVKELEVAKTKAMLGAHAERYNNYTKWWYKEKQTQNIEEMEEQVVLVNEKDEVQGTLGKLEAHEKGLLHQAISIVLFNEAGEILLQQRAANKYHWANIWSNTVCTHPRLNESHQTAAERRLYEELGFNTPLSNIFSFIYKATDEESGLIEHEFDHVFTGKYNGKIPFNPDEVQAVKWIKPNDLLVDIKQNPEKYSFWFKIILEEMQKRELLNH